MTKQKGSGSGMIKQEMERVEKAFVTLLTQKNYYIQTLYFCCHILIID